jgi:uncharacterized protein YdeI (YjbR/CyaY-like superfamily)
MSENVKPGEKIPTLPFRASSEWNMWLEENHASSPGIWLKLAKNSSGIQSIFYNEELNEALCYGWIDNQKKAFEKHFLLQKFSQRQPKIVSYKRNRQKIEMSEKEDGLYL